MFEKVKYWYRALPEKKRYLEFITALLSIPVLVTVILSNVTNLRDRRESEKNKTQPTNTVTERIIIITQKEENRQIKEGATVPTIKEQAPTNEPTPTPPAGGSPAPTVTPSPTPTPPVGTTPTLTPTSTE